MPETQHFWVLILSPGTSTRGATWDLDSRRRGPRLAAPRTSTRSATDLSQGPLAPRVEVLGAASRGPLHRELRPHVAPRVQVPWDKIETQKR